ncbi:hypothetical protein TSUD_16490 [Trifolium subterraneum]|uniref:Neurobeachin beta-propeller domain-containing protein n=1 Tax=Trifolium subterraneum TaxID=3900 RepID=A0A2Z6MRL8_TRISU|nr:hypothetical protein TSUD_16490 [Trifolium subterraneum]
MEVVLASSSIDDGIGCWDIHTGAEQPRYKSCSSPFHGLVSLGPHFLASSQLQHSSSTSGSVFFWSSSKPQVEVKSFPVEPIKPLAVACVICKVETGRLLKKWHAHLRAITCLVFSEDDSLLISGSEDGYVRVWSLFRLFDDLSNREAKNLYEYSFSEHTMRVSDVVIGYGGSSAIIVSASDDRTCKVWSLSSGTLLRSIVFPSIINAIALDPAEHVFYAGSSDGNIYIAALNTERITTTNNYGKHIIGSFSNHSKAVTCLTYGKVGDLLISGSEDGIVRVWNAKTRNIVRMFKHAKGPITNVLVVRQEVDPSNHISSISNLQASTKKKPLEKYANSTDEDSDVNTVISLGSSRECMDQQGSATASEIEIEKLKHEYERTMKMANQWKKMYENLHQFGIKELLDGDQIRTS